jgi:hypothetical protein
VEEGHAADGPLVCEIGEEALQMRGDHQALVDDRARRHGNDVRVDVVLAIGRLGPPAGEVERTVELDRCHVLGTSDE